MADGTTEDDVLIERSRSGDPAAIRELVVRHADMTYRIAYRMVGHKAQAEDIAQDVLMRMLDYRNGWLSRLSLRAWLRRAVFNRVVDIHRKNRRWMFGGLDEAADAPDARPGQDTAMAQQETDTLVSRAVMSLPLRQRAAVTLCFFEHLSLAEAASVIGVSEGAVESLLHRAKTALKLALRDMAAQHATENKTKRRNAALQRA